MSSYKLLIILERVFAVSFWSFFGYAIYQENVLGVFEFFPAGVGIIGAILFLFLLDFYPCPNCKARKWDGDKSRLILFFGKRNCEECGEEVRWG